MKLRPHDDIVRNAKILIPWLLVILFATIFLASCNNSGNKGPDGYYFEGKERSGSTEVLITTIEYSNLRDLRKVAISYGLDPNTKAFNLYQASTNTCIIHIIDPAVTYDPISAGHEYLHCQYGNFHIEQDPSVIIKK